MMKRLFATLFAVFIAVSPPTALAAQPSSHQLVRVDQSELTYHLSQRTEDPQGILLMFQGSGCNSVATNENISLFGPIIAPDHAIVTIEKYGVAVGATDPENCSEDYWEHATIQQRIIDALQVIASLRGQDWWDGDLVVFGGSEGGAVAAMLAPLVPETDAAIIFSSGIGWPVGDMIRAAIPPQAGEEFDTVIASARANPTGSIQWGGASYRWWANSVDLVPALALVGSDFPLLLVHGERDQFAPVETARASQQIWVEHNRPNTTYREYAGHDHFMVDAEGTNHNIEVFADIAEWLDGQTISTNQD